MPAPEDAQDLPAALRCRAEGCRSRRVGSGDLCARHLNERLQSERDRRERARGDAGHWASWAPEAARADRRAAPRADAAPERADAGAPAGDEVASAPGAARSPSASGVDGEASGVAGARTLEPPGDAEPGGAAPPEPGPPPAAGAPAPDAGSLHADLRRRVRRAEAREELPPWAALFGPEALLKRLEGAARLLPPDLEAKAWQVAHEAASPGHLLDPDALADAVRDPLGALGRALGGAARGAAAGLDPGTAREHEREHMHERALADEPAARAPAGPGPEPRAPLDPPGGGARARPAASASDPRAAPEPHAASDRQAAAGPQAAASDPHAVGAADRAAPPPRAGSLPPPPSPPPPPFARAQPRVEPPPTTGAAAAALFGALGRAASSAVTAFAAEIGAGARASGAPSPDGRPRPDPGAPPPGLDDLGHEAGLAFGRTARAAAEAAREIRPGVFAALGKAGEALAEGASLGFAAFERTVGGALGGALGPAFSSGLREASELGRSAATGLLRPFVPGLGVSERIADGLSRAGALAAWLRRRARGDEVDDDGFDPALFDLALHPLRWIARLYFRFEVEGAEHVPPEGPALIVANQAGLVPLAGALVALAAHDAARTANQRPPGAAAADPFGRAFASGAAAGPRGRARRRPAERPVRVLAPPWLRRLGGSTLLARLGAVPAEGARLEALLAAGEVCAAFPEGAAALGKPFRRRATVLPFVELALFRAAVRAGAPVIPCALDGLEEAQPVLWSSPRAGHALGLPALPVTPSFPWLGPLGLVPLPARVRLRFGAPLEPAPGPPGEPLRHLGAEADRARALAARAHAAVQALRIAAPPPTEP